ncbi:uncharacterized protein [Onthophagus taurus]|uniref:uncharacterized protein n=1 Tax=Onthophagus taurus TaxID=166361 RepID=UPI0039BEB9B6
MLRHLFLQSAAKTIFLFFRFLATGETFRSLAFTFRISYGYISIIVKEVIEELRNKLVPLYLKQPTCSDFEKIAKDFYGKWNFPNCIGAIDGKHIRILCPKNSGSLFFNYKNYFSIVLLAIVDSNYKFTAINVGSYGKEGDSSIFEKSPMGNHIRSGTFNIPDEKALPGSDVVLPHVIVGDEAFRLAPHMMKPYPKNQATLDNSKAIFNYRLCRARRVSENAFALLSQTFRIFYAPIAVKPETTDAIIPVTCCLHNMLRDEYLQKGKPIYNQDIELPVNNMFPIARGGGFGNVAGFEIRNQFKDYFNSPQGSVQWQEDWVRRGLI